MPSMILSVKEIKWAWRKKCEGFTTQDIAKALYVDSSTITRAWLDMYGKTKPDKNELIPLVYEEEEC